MINSFFVSIANTMSPVNFQVSAVNFQVILFTLLHMHHYFGRAPVNVAKLWLICVVLRGMKELSDKIICTLFRSSATIR